MAFGRALERARFHHFACLHDRKHILLLGDGDGRGLALALRVAPSARITSLDSSEGMLARAARRLTPNDRARVTFLHADVRVASFPENTYDAVTTLFFLDCFSSEQVEALIKGIRPSLTENALWLYADFALPANGWAHWRARVWLSLMFTFFRVQTGLTIRALPSSEALLRDSGFERGENTTWLAGFLRSAVYQLPHPFMRASLPGHDHPRT